MDPFRLPSCGEYSFGADGNRINPLPLQIAFDPACRHGMSVAVLRGQNRTLDLSQVDNKLDQYIDYHRESDRHNLSWSPDLHYTWALWGGSLPYFSADALTSMWSTMTLNGVLDNYRSAKFITDGTALARRQAFKGCLASGGEMCLFNGHGSPTSILFEGVGVLNQHYADDRATMSSGEAGLAGPNAKYVEMMACSSQAFLVDGSFATTLLMSGRTMLTYGSSTTSWGSANFVLTQAQELYSYLALGGTFAEAVRGSLRGDGTSMQGDPYISFRPVPLNSPKLVINGKHYNDGNFIYPMKFSDSIGGSASQIVLNLSNAGTVDLHIQLSWASYAWSINSRPIPEGGFNGGFSLRDPYPISGNPHSAIGNNIYTIKPNDTMKVTYQMAPLAYNPAIAPLTGIQGATLQLFSDDPASYKVTLDATMRVQ